MLSPRFRSRLASDLEHFLAFKRALGFKYDRSEFILRSFDRYVAEHAPRRGRLPLERLLRDWLARIEGRKPVTVTNELAAMRQFFRFRRRSAVGGFVPGRDWAPQSTTSGFLPHIFTLDEVRTVLVAADELPGPPLRAQTFRMLIVILYCTGLRPGEAVRLTLDDVDLRRRTFVVRESKGKTRLVPFRADLARWLERYRRARLQGAPRTPGFLVQPNGKPYPSGSASRVLRLLFRRVGLKPARGRVGPRPFDFRHTFAVHRLTKWYRSKIDLQTRLPWLSAYMGHENLLGTEAYLTATPELLATASRRFAAHAYVQALG